METPLIAVFMVTYNHELFISQSIESVLAQKTNFAFKLFIGEDGSTDRTGELCQQYADRFPQHISLFIRSKNLGVFENANQLFQACLDSGAKYIALLEGDDCWLGTEKLQRQVSFLEENPDCAATYHNTDFLFSNGERKSMFKSLREKMTLKDVIAKYAPFHTTSFVFRSSHFCRPSWFKDIHSVDLAMYIWHAQFGYFKGFQETWSLYRIHGAGLTAGQDHQAHFHQKRWLLHQMMNGKIYPPFQQASRDLLRFHESELSQHSKPELNHLLFFNTIHDFETAKLKMSLAADILPFEISNHCWNGFLGQFSLSSWRRFNGWKLWFFYRKQWKNIRAVVFLNQEDLLLFKSFFGNLSLPYWIVGSATEEMNAANEHYFSKENKVGADQVLWVAESMNELLHQTIES
jgi:glycosyltransferase involved in cell wall biosynthesis